MRLFVAIEIPGPLRERMANMCFGVQGARWISKENMHLTIRFIGSVSHDCYVPIVENLAQIHAQPFSIVLQGVGYFPPRGKPRVLWVGVAPNLRLMELAGSVERALQRSGCAPEKRSFSPHITLGRLRDRTRFAAIADFLAANNLFCSEPIDVESFHLFSSETTPRGAVYHKEQSFEL